MSPIEPTAALRLVLPGIVQRIPPTRMDELWLFAPRLINDRETGLLVLSLYCDEEQLADDREIFTLEYQAHFIKGMPRVAETLTEQGRAPVDRIHRIIDGVLVRIGDEGAEPDVYTIEGSDEVWSDLLTSLGVTTLDPA